MAVIDIRTEEELDALLGRADTLIIDFWAPWCPPCKVFAPIFREASDRHPDVAFCRIDTQDDSGLSDAFGVSHIPTLVVVRDRVMVASQEGYLKEAQLDDLLRQVAELDMAGVMEEEEEEAP